MGRGKLLCKYRRNIFFDLKTPDQGIEALNKASYAFQVSGKFTYAVKSFVTTAERFMENKEFETAKRILNEAFNVCAGNTEDKLIGATFEQIYNKLFSNKVKALETQ